MLKFATARFDYLLVFAAVLLPMTASCSREKTPDTDTKPERDRVLAECTEAIRLNPKDANAHYKRGLRYDEIGEPDKAITDYTRAIRLNDPRAYVNRGAAYRKKHAFDNAIADYSEVIRFYQKSATDPGDAILRAGVTARAYYNRGVCYDEKGQHDKAIADYKEAVRIEPSLLDENLKKRMKQ